MYEASTSAPSRLASIHLHQERPKHQTAQHAAVTSDKEARNEEFDPDEVFEVLRARFSKPKRQFYLKWANGDTDWVKETDCNNCEWLIRTFCQAKNLPCSSLPRQKNGFTGQGEFNEANWAYPEEIVDKAVKYSKLTSLQYKLFITLDEEDSLYAVEIGTHCYGVLYQDSTCGRWPQLLCQRQVGTDYVQTILPEREAHHNPILRSKPRE